METLDWIKLSTSVVKDNKVSYEENKHLFTKVAFDVFQLNTSPAESLWILQECEDGKQYLVAQYDDEDEAKLEVKSNWLALSDQESKNITLAYKETPIQRFASTDFGFTPEDINVFKRLLIEKLSSDKSFVDKLLKSQPEEKRKLILAQFPELA